MDVQVSISADNREQTQIPQKKVVRLDSPVIIERKVVASITNTSAFGISGSGIDVDSVDTPVENSVEFSRADFIGALMKVSQPIQPQPVEGN